MRLNHIKIFVGIFALIFSISVLHAGGFLLVSRTGEIYTWDASAPIPFNPDRGMLGVLTNTEAVNLVTESFDVWNGENIPTSSLSFVNTGLLSQDIVTEEDFSMIDGNNDGNNPIIFDVDGSMFEALGFPPGVIGFAGPEFFTINDPFLIVEGLAALNGQFLDNNQSNGEIPREEFLGVMAHEFGHYLNLGHAQVNGHFFIGDRDDPGFAMYGNPPIESVTFMFPLFVPTQAPTTDDIRAISTLYPAQGFPIEFGTIQGRVFTSNGEDQFQGANVIVRNVDDPFFDAGSMVSGEFFRPLFTSPPETPLDGNLRGFYRANGLTNGASYTVEVVNINPRFARGSRVGPINVPVEVPGNEEFWNGEGETGETSDDPLDFETIVPNGPVLDIDIILNEPPFTITLDKFDVDNFRFILSVQSLITSFDTPSGSDDYAAVRFSIPASVVAPFTVTKGEFFNNDNLTTWPRVLLTTPNENDQPDLENPLAESNDVVGPESAFMSVPFDVRRESFEDLFFVIQFPPGEALSAGGSGGGPALGGDADLDIGFREFVAGNLFSTDGVNFGENITSFQTGSIPVANWAMSIEILPDTTQQDALEPNNDMANATAINFGEARRASIDPATDVDYFGFTGSAGDTISADVDAFALNSPLDGKLTLLDALGDTVAQNDNESQEAADPLLRTVLPENGDFFLVMESVDTNVGGPEAFYEIQLNMFSPPFEPNNNVNQATAIDTGEVIFEALDLPDDIDFFAFEGAQNEFLTVQLGLGNSSLDPVLTLFDTDGSTVIAVEEQPTLQTRLPSTGTFFLAVADLEERSGADFFYGLAIFKAEPNLAPPGELIATGFKDRVELSWGSPVPVEIEPNNAPDQAQELLGPSPVSVNANAEISDQGELDIVFSDNSTDNVEDLYVVDIQSSGLTVRLSDLLSDLDVYLIDEGITRIIDASQNSGTQEEQIIQPGLAAGTYFIGVSIFDNAPGLPNESPYTLTVTGDIPAGGPTLQSYNVYRSEMPVAFTTGEVIANVDASTTSFTDTELPPDEFFYQVTAVFDFGEGPPSNEASAVVTSVADNSPNLPTEYALNQNYPNPFNPSTVINYAIPVFHNNQNVTLEIFNTLGQKVRTLVDEVQPAGRYTVEWDGTNEFGNPVTTGLYVYRLRAGTFINVKKMVFIK